MTSEEIKKNISMPEVVRRYGIKINRNGFCICPFHKEKTPSMKIYENSFYCFGGCGASGDIFTFVQKMDNCDFKTAFLTLGGTYERLSTNEQKHALRDAENAKRLREKEEKRLSELKAKLPDIIDRMDAYRQVIRNTEPYSDLWCFCMEEYHKELYQYEMIREEVSK